MSIENLTLAHFRHVSSLFTNFPSTLVENSLQISPFYAKQSQSQVRRNQPKHCVNNEIRKNGHLVIQTKQTQFKANKAKNKANSNPIKPKTNPIQSQFVEKAKFNAFAWIRSLTMILIMLLADFTTLKGANCCTIGSGYCL